MASFVRKIWIAFQPLVKSMRLSDAFLRGGNPPALGLCVENGETLVLGGILREDANDAKRKTPILGDVPLLGRLFRCRITRQDQQELLVFCHT